MILSVSMYVYFDIMLQNDTAIQGDSLLKIMNGVYEMGIVWF